MGIEIDGKNLTAIQLGDSTGIDEVYFGATKIWPAPTGNWWDGDGAINSANVLGYWENFTTQQLSTDHTRAPGDPFTIVAFSVVSPEPGNQANLFETLDANVKVTDIFYNLSANSMQIRADVDLVVSGYTPNNIGTGRAFTAFATQSGSHKGYVKGETADTWNNVTGIPVGVNHPSIAGWFGSGGTGGSPFWGNTISHAAVYDIKLSDAQIEAIRDMVWA